MVTNNLHNVDTYFGLSINCLDTIQPSTKMANINWTIQTYVDVPIANGVNLSCNYIDYKYSKISNVDYASRASKVFVSSIFLNNIPLYQSIPKSKWNVKCLKQFYDVNMYFLSNGNYISN